MFLHLSVITLKKTYTHKTYNTHINIHLSVCKRYINGREISSFRPFCFFFFFFLNIHCQVRELFKQIKCTMEALVVSSTPSGNSHLAATVFKPKIHHRHPPNAQNRIFATSSVPISLLYHFKLSVKGLFINRHIQV